MAENFDDLKGDDSGADFIDKDNYQKDRFLETHKAKRQPSYMEPGGWYMNTNIPGYAVLTYAKDKNTDIPLFEIRENTNEVKFVGRTTTGASNRTGWKSTNHTGVFVYEQGGVIKAALDNDGLFIAPGGIQIDTNGNLSSTAVSGGVSSQPRRPIPLQIESSTAMKLPSGNTGQRPQSPSNGYVRYNTQTSRIEYYAGSWKDVMKLDDLTSLGGALGALIALTPEAGKIVRFTSATAADLLNFRNQATMSANDPLAVPSQRSVKIYVDSAETRMTQEVNSRYANSLKALASITPATNKIPYFTSSSTGGTLNFRDENDLVSNDASGVPSQRSVKKYIDDNFPDNPVSYSPFVSPATIWRSVQKAPTAAGVTSMKLDGWETASPSYLKIKVNNMRVANDAGTLSDLSLYIKEGDSGTPKYLFSILRFDKTTDLSFEIQMFRTGFSVDLTDIFGGNRPTFNDTSKTRMSYVISTFGEYSYALNSNRGGKTPWFVYTTYKTQGPSNFIMPKPNESAFSDRFNVETTNTGDADGGLLSFNDNFTEITLYPTYNGTVDNTRKLVRVDGSSSLQVEYR